MSDRTNLTMEVKTRDPLIVADVRAAFEHYSGGDLHFEDEHTDVGVRIGANDVRCGSATNLAADLRAIISERGEFAFCVFEDPAYEWLGTAAFHVPGTGDLKTDCDASGRPHVATSTVAEMVASATDLDELKALVATSLGHEVTAAYAAYRG